MGIAALKLPITGPVPTYGGSSQLVAPSADTTASITGVTAAYQAICALTLASGAFLTDEQVSGADGVIVLDNRRATTLFGSGTAVGETVRAGSKVLRVIGVLNLKGSGGFGSVDDQALVPITVAQQQLYGARTPDGNGWKVSSIQISVTNRTNITTVQTRIQSLLRQRHSLAADGTKDGFQVQNQASLLSSLSTVTTLLTYFLASVAGISLLVGGIGVMNIMLSYARRKDPMTHPCARILVVDDEAIIRLTLEAMLRRQGYAVWMAADAQEAFMWLCEGAFDLLLIDLKLPGRVSGLDIAEGARVSQPDAAVLILTGSSELEDTACDASRPQFETMFKTASPQDVLDRVAALLALKQGFHERTRDADQG